MKGKLKKLLLEAEGGYIPIPRKIANVLGANASMLLSELCDRYDYYSELNLLNEYGEFYYTIAEAEVNTGLHRREQETAIKTLKESKFIDSTTPRGLPKKRYFKMSDEIPKLLTVMIVSADEIKETVKEKTIKEVKRCENLTNPVGSPVGTKPPLLMDENASTIVQNIHYDCTKQPVNKNYDKQLTETTISTTISDDETNRIKAAAQEDIPYEEREDIFADYVDKEDFEEEPLRNNNPFNITIEAVKSKVILEPVKDNVRNITFTYKAPKPTEVTKSVTISGDKDFGFDDGLDF